MTIYLIITGAYANRTIGPAFLSRAAAEAYQQEQTDNPPRTLGPTGPIRIVEIDVYNSAREAIDAER